MANRLTQFIENIKKYTNSDIRNIDIFDCLFMSMDEICNIKKKNPESSGLNSSVVSKIMNGKMDIPKKYLKAAKSISPNDIADSIDTEICRYINEDDQKRLRKDLASFIVKDDYYNNDEKNDIAQCCIENDTSLLIANVFILLLRKTENEYNSNLKIIINCYANGKIFNSLKLQNLRDDIENYINNKKREIGALYEKVNSIHIENTESKIVNNSALPNNQLAQISSMMDALNKKVEIDDEIKKHINVYANKYSIELVDDFYDLGLLKESVLHIPGQRSEKYGTETEIEKYNSILKLYWNIKDHVQLLSFNNELNFSHCLKIAINNPSNKDDSDVTVKLLFPKNSVFVNYDYCFSNKDSASLFISLYNKYFDIKETIDYELYNGYSMLKPVDISNNFYINPLFGNQVDENISEANSLLDSLNRFELIDDNKHDVIKLHINKIKKNSIILLPVPILLVNEINQIEYMIESSNIIGDKIYYMLKK